MITITIKINSESDSRCRVVCKAVEATANEMLLTKLFQAAISRVLDKIHEEFNKAGLNSTITTITRDHNQNEQERE